MWVRRQKNFSVTGFGPHGEPEPVPRASSACKFLGDLVSPLRGGVALVDDSSGADEGRGIVVVGVSIDVDGDAYHRFLKQHGINFVTVRDPDQKVAGMYGTSGWPETYIIDRQGVLRRKFVGPVDWNAPDVVCLSQAGCRSARMGSLGEGGPSMLKST